MSEPTAPAPVELADPTTLGGLGRADLGVALRPLWEEAGPLVDRLCGREVSSWEQHLDLAATEIAAMSDSERAQLLQAHPRIGAPPGELAARSTISLREQGGDAGADPEVLAELDVLNRRYEERFGFPFVEWVAGRSRRQMLGVIETRLLGARDDELATGCTALVAIARDRLARLTPTIGGT